MSAGPPGQPAGDAYDWVRRAQDLHDAGNPAAAAELLAHAAAMEPTARSVREAWARALFDARRYDDAAREFLALTELAPDDHYAHFGAGLALWRQQRFTAASEHLTVAVAMRPGRAEYATAQRQVRATLEARAEAGLPADGPIDGPIDAAAVLPATAGTTAAPPSSALTAHPLVQEHDAFLLDLDGVVYRGAAALPHAASCLAAARARGVRLAFVTNNAARPAAEVADHLRELGIEAQPEDVTTSAQAGARLVLERVGESAAVLAVGGPGVDDALTAAGLRPVRRARDGETEPVAAVLMGYGPDVSWRDLAAASYAVTGGAVFVATNTDLTIPTADGIAPGNGTLVEAVRHATGVEPAVAGKPFPPLTSLAMTQVGGEHPLVVGDRLDTDIQGASGLELPSLLVLTGVTGAEELLQARPDRRPTYLAADLRGVLGRGRRFVPDPEAAEVGEDGRLRLGPGDDDPLRRLRAAAWASWAATDADADAQCPADVHDALTEDVRRALDG